MKLLLDTDVLIDLALARDPHAGPAAELLDRLEAQPGRSFFSWHTASNFYYLVAPKRGGRPAKEFLADLTRFAGVAPADSASLRYAARLPMRDFEDAMQVAAARACGAEAIVTRNTRDYARSPIPAWSPRRAVREL